MDRQTDERTDQHTLPPIELLLQLEIRELSLLKLLVTGNERNLNIKTCGYFVNQYY